MASAAVDAAAASALLSVSGWGAGGIQQMAKVVVDDNVQFGLMRFTFGVGTFKRDKLILLNLSMDGCPGIRRAKINSKKAEVKKIIGETNAEIVITSASELSIDHILGELSKIIASDNTSSSVNLAAMKKDYEAMIAAAKAKGGDEEGGGAAAGGAGAEAAPVKPVTTEQAATEGRGRKTAAELGRPVSGAMALDAVRKALGPFNWALFHGTPGDSLELVNAGSLSVNEMKRFMTDSDAYYGLLRLGFGAGKFRRTKYIGVQFVGGAMPIVKRGKSTSCAGDMKRKLGSVSVDLQVSSIDEITLEAIIEKVKRAAVIDGDDVSSDAFSMDAFLKALEEETKANADFYGDGGVLGTAAAAPRPPKPVAEIIADIRKGEGAASGANWAIFTVNV